VDGKPFSHSHSDNRGRASPGMAPGPSSILANDWHDGTASSEWEAGLKDVPSALPTGIILCYCGPVFLNLQMILAWEILLACWWRRLGFKMIFTS